MDSGYRIDKSSSLSSDGVETTRSPKERQWLQECQGRSPLNIWWQILGNRPGTLGGANVREFLSRVGPEWLFSLRFEDDMKGGCGRLPWWQGLAVMERLGGWHMTTIQTSSSTLSPESKLIPEQPDADVCISCLDKVMSSSGNKMAMWSPHIHDILCVWKYHVSLSNILNPVSNPYLIKPKPLLTYQIQYFHNLHPSFPII